jgi:hypothetical protein
MGLIWLLQGQSVIALTVDAASIQTAGGNRLSFYRRKEMRRPDARPQEALR